MSATAPVPRYAVVPHARSPLSGHEILLVTRAGERHVLTTDVLAALDLMQGFRSLAEHRAALLQALPQLAKQAEQVGRVLDSLVQRGLLRTAEARWAELSASRPASTAPLRVVYFLGGGGAAARDPLPPLRALAAEFGSGLAGSAVDVLVVAAADGSAADVAALQAAAAPLPLRVLEREHLVEWLARLGEGVLAGAGQLAQSFAAAPANLAQLLGAGRRVLWLDDRQHLPLRRFGAASGELLLDESTARQVRLYEHHRAALEAGTAAPGRLAQLAALCGSPVGALDGLGLRLLPPADLASAGFASLDPYAADGRVRSVVCGTLGCAEGEHSLWLYLADPQVRAQLDASREAYDRGIAAEAMAHGSPQFRLQRGGAFRPLLLDATQPYGLVPAGTLHSERVLHALGSCAAPSSLVAQADDLAGYSTVLARPRASANQDVSGPGLNTYVADQALLRRGELLAEAPGERLQALAALLRDQAGAAPAQRRVLLWEYLAWQQGQVIAALQGALEQAGETASRPWQEDLGRIVQNHGRSLLQARVARLAETPDGHDQAQAGEHLAQLLQAAAAKLELWPELFEAARDQQA